MNGAYSILDFRIVLPGHEQFPGGAAGLPPFLSRYRRLYDLDKLSEGTLEQLLGDMDANGIARGVLQAEYSYGDFRRLNEAVSRAVRDHPQRFVGFGTVNPADSADLVRDVEEVHDRLGLRGVNLQPWAYGIHASDRRFYPLYEKCVELGIPVTIHCSINFSTDRPIDFGRPLHLDRIACDFPELRIVANHGGWPWVTEMVAVAWKHPQVFIEIGGIAPKYLAKTGTGWEPLLLYANSLLQDQVLFATDSIVPYRRAVPEFQALPLKDEVKRKILGINARKLLGLENQNVA